MNKYIYLSKEKAKQGISLVFYVGDTPVENMEEYFEGQACLFIGEDLPHFITYIKETNTVREATEEEKLARNQRELSTNEILDKNGKIISYDEYSQKIINGKIVNKTRKDYIDEGIITLETEREKSRFERDKQFKGLDLYDKAVLRGDIKETIEMKKQRDLFRKEWLEIPNKYIDISNKIEDLFPVTPQNILYFI